MRAQDYISHFAIAAALVGGWVVPASAQVAADNEAEYASSNDIVVTARRKNENLQDVPLTVTAVTDANLKELNLFTGADLPAVVPGLSLAPRPGQGDPVLSLRGAAKGDNSTAQPTVQTYLNEAPMSATLAFQGIYDIGQVEVLRGPQGTLRGRPSSSGAITFTTKRPDLNEITGDASFAVSSLNQIRVEGAVSVPIIQDVLAVRVAGLVDHNDGDGVRSLNNRTKPFGRTESWRASLRFTPTSTVEINLMYQDFHSDRRNYLQVAGPGYQGPSTPAQGVPLPRNFNGPAISAQDRLAVAHSPYRRKAHYQSFIGQGSVELGDHTLSFVGSYTDVRKVDRGGGDNANFYVGPMVHPGLAFNARDRNHSAEVRLEKSGSSFWDYGVGLYYEKSKSVNLFSDVVTYLPGAFGAPGAVPSITNFNPIYSYTISGLFPILNTTKAIYANSTFHITPRTDLYVGVRYTDYRATTSQNGGLINGLTATGAPSTICNFVPSQGAGPAYPSTIRVGQCDLPLPNRPAFDTTPVKQNFTPLVYTASLTHRITDDVTAYGSYGHSWRPGTNNFNLASTDARIHALAITDEEESDNFELGLKTQFLDKRLTINVAAFYQKFSGYLYFVRSTPYLNDTGLTPSVSRNNLTVNADAEVRGFDLEVGFRPSRQFSIGGSINYARGRLSNALVPCNDSNFDGKPDGGVVTVAGFAAARVPVAYCRSSDALSQQADWNGTMQAEYNAPVSSSTEAYARALVSYTPTNRFAPTSFTARNYAIANFYLGVRSNDGHWDIGGYVRNLTNANIQLSADASEIGTPTAAQAALGVAPGSGYRGVSTTLPREFGATIRYSW